MQLARKNCTISKRVVLQMIGERIKEVREKNGLTQALLAKKLGISRSAVNAWEMGISVPSAQYLIELSRLFKVSTDYILEVECQEALDVTFLDDDEKAIIYSMLNYFKKCRNTVSISEKWEQDQLKDIDDMLRRQGSSLQGYLDEVVNESVKEIMQNLFGKN